MKVELIKYMKYIMYVCYGFSSATRISYNNKKENAEKKEGNTLAFSHLYVRSGYSFMKSIVRIPQLIEKAKQLQMRAVALTDEQVMHGAVTFYQLAKQAGIKPIIGMIVPILEENDEITTCITLAKNNQGYQDLLKLSTLLHLEEKQGVSLQELYQYSHHLFIIIPARDSRIVALIEEKKENEVVAYLNNWNKVLTTDICLGIQQNDLHHTASFQRVLSQLPNQAVAIQEVRYLEQDDQLAYSCLHAMEQGVSWSRPSSEESSNQYFCSEGEMRTAFQVWPELIENVDKVTLACQVSLTLHEPALPKYPLKPSQTASNYLRLLCEEALEAKYPDLEQGIIDRLDHELNVIETMRFSDYFLIVWDFVNYAKQNGILVGPGRGSAAGSLVAYLLNITEIDPIKYQLLFERFLNPERVSMPDIDIDFSDHRRDEVIAYVKEKYGKEHVAQIGTFGTFGTRSVIRELVKTMDVSPEDTAFILKEISNQSTKSITESVKASSSLINYIKESPKLQQLFKVAIKLEGLPRHLSTHAAGVIISELPLVHHVALTKGNNDMNLTQLAMNDVEALGLLKIDFLGLHNLTLIERMVQAIEKNESNMVNMKELPLDDRHTFQLLQRGQTNGVFQLESQGMQRVLHELRPNQFEDIVAVNALYRPGPMEFISTYVNRKHGEESVHYLHDDLKPILERTYGVLVYQEQIMQIAHQLSGFSLGQADILRRAVSKKKADEIKELEVAFISGCQQNGYDHTVATSIFDWIVRFSNYGFNRSHAVAYSKISYQLAYLKAHYPAYFFAEMLSNVASQPDKLRGYTNEAKSFGITLLPPSINHSNGKFTVANNHIRIGLWAIKGIGNQVVQEIIRVRKAQPFRNLFDFCMRVSSAIVKRSVIESLILVGAFDELFNNRASLLATIDQALEQAELFNEFDEPSSLFQNELALDVDYVEVTPFSNMQQLNYEKELVGIYLSDHPLTASRQQLRQHGYITLSKLKDFVNKNNRKLVAIIQTIKVIRTKRGDQMAFLTISDESNEIETVLFPQQYREVKSWLKEEMIVEITGKPEFRNHKLQVLIATIQPFSPNQLEQQQQPRIYIKLETKAENQAIMDLKKLAEQYPGSAAIIIYHVASEKTYQLSPKYNLQLEKSCLQTLYDVFDRNNVVIKHEKGS